MDKISEFIRNNPWAAVYIAGLILVFIFKERIKNYYSKILVPKIVALLLKEKRGEKDD